MKATQAEEQFYKDAADGPSTQLTGVHHNEKMTTFHKCEGVGLNVFKVSWNSLATVLPAMAKVSANEAERYARERGWRNQQG